MSADDHPEWLPELLSWEGDEAGTTPTTAYEDRMYALYERDFVHATPTFRGWPVLPKREPEHNGRCGTFHHCISQTINKVRVVRRRRCERIPWIRAMVEAADDTSRVKVYGVVHEPNELRFEIALADFSHIVVLAQRTNHYLLYASLPHEYPNARRKAAAKYEAWLNAQKKLKPHSP